MKRILKSKYHLLFSVLPIVIIIGGFKLGIHLLGLEFIPKDMVSFFPSILTGIIFLLGFLLAGVVTDYKESEKIPNEIAASLFAIWQEAVYAKEVSNSKYAENILVKIKNFIPTFSEDYLILRNKKLEKLIDSLSHDIIEMGKEGVAPNYIIRVKTEVTNLKKTINRISIIRNTDFIPSVFVSIKTIAFIFLIVYSLLIVEPWWMGLILVFIFTFIIFSILFLIKDMENPFEYDASKVVKSDEVSIQVLADLQKEFNESQL